MIGTTRTHVNFFMNKFRQLGLIEYNGDIKVHRSLLNMLLHEKLEMPKRPAASSVRRPAARGQKMA